MWGMEERKSGRLTGFEAEAAGWMMDMRIGIREFYFK